MRRAWRALTKCKGRASFSHRPSTSSGFRLCTHATIAVASLLVAPREASAHPTYTNEPEGSAPFYYCDFNSGSLCGMIDTYNSMSDEFVRPGGSGTMASPAGALRMRTEGGNGSGQGDLYFPKQREAFVGATWRNEVYGYTNGSGKLFFVREPSNSLLDMNGPAGHTCKRIVWAQQERVDNSHVAGVYGTNWDSQQDGTGWFEPNVNPAAAEVCWGGGWTKLEVYLRGSTTNVSKDGIIRIWVNGVLTSDFTNVNQGTDLADFPGGFSHFSLNHAWDGSAGVLAEGGEVWQHFWDDIYISFPNCESGCPVTADTLAPSAPTNVRVE